MFVSLRPRVFGGHSLTVCLGPSVCVCVCVCGQGGVWLSVYLITCVGPPGPVFMSLTLSLRISLCLCVLMCLCSYKCLYESVYGRCLSFSVSGSQFTVFMSSLYISCCPWVLGLASLTVSLCPCLVEASSAWVFPGGRFWSGGTDRAWALARKRPHRPSFTSLGTVAGLREVTAEDSWPLSS